MSWCRILGFDLGNYEVAQLALIVSFTCKTHKGKGAINNARKWTHEHECEFVNMNMWVGMDIFGIFWWQGHNILRIPLCHIRMTWKIFFHMYMDESHKMDGKLDESWTLMTFLDDHYKKTNCLDERFNKLKCMNETNS